MNIEGLASATLVGGPSTSHERGPSIVASKRKSILSVTFASSDVKGAPQRLGSYGNHNPKRHARMRSKKASLTWTTSLPSKVEREALYEQ